MSAEHDRGAKDAVAVRRSDGEAAATRVVAVIAHRKKSLGGGLPALRRQLAAEGIEKPIWHEVDKSKRAPKAVRRARKDGADLFFVWGGDGMVQRCAGELAGTPATMAILPAGTANLLAANLGIPEDLDDAVATGLRGDVRSIDLGIVEGEHFAVMAGTGLDARIMRDTPSKTKERLGRIAYVAALIKNLRRPRVGVRVDADGETWFRGRASCVLVGNAGSVFGGLRLFPAAQLDDGRLEVGVATPAGAGQWLRVLGRVLLGDAPGSPFVRERKAKVVEIVLDEPLPYELDGGDRSPRRHLRIEVVPAALRVCVPRRAVGGSP